MVLELLHDTFWGSQAEHRQLARFSARLETISETIALLRMEYSCRPSEPGTGCQSEAVARGTCTASMLRMHQQA
jgi:hypothetical protein